jgi:hypothetical protein
VLQRLIVGAYRVGHDSIEIRTDLPLAPERVEELLAAARGLLGVSVVSQEPNRIVLQNFIDPSKYGLPQLVARQKMILVAFLEEMEEVLRRHGRSRRTATLEEEANKVLALLVRQLFLASRDWSLARRIGSPDPRQLLEWRVVVHALEELAELFAEALAALNEAIPAKDDASAEDLSVYLPEIKGQLKEVVEALMHPSLDHACEVYHAGGLMNEDTGSLTNRRSTIASRGGARTAKQLLQRASACLSLLAEVAIDRAVASGNETILVEAA